MHDVEGCRGHGANLLAIFIVSNRLEQAVCPYEGASCSILSTIAIHTACQRAMPTYDVYFIAHRHGLVLFTYIKSIVFVHRIDRVVHLGEQGLGGRPGWRSGPVVYFVKSAKAPALRDPAFGGYLRPPRTSENSW